MNIGTIENWQISHVDVDSITVRKDHYHGIIRRSDLSYFRIAEDLTKRFHIGNTIKAMVVDNPPQEPLILSVKDLENPAWEKFYRNHKINDIIIGRVLRVQPDEGSLIQIEQSDGVIGIIHPSEEVNLKETTPFLIAGDQVRTMIIGFNQEQKCVILSIKRLYQAEFSKNIRSFTTLGDIGGEELKLYAFRHDLFGQHPYDAEIMKLKEQGIKTILFCDNDENVCKSYQRSFQSAGFETIIAIGGKEGIEKSKSETFELAIIDLHMDNIDGCDVALSIQKVNSAIKIIIVTGINNIKNYGYEPKLMELKLLNNILRKPFTIRGLVQKLEKMENNHDENSNLLNQSIIESIGEIIKDTFHLDETLEHVLNLIKNRFSTDAVCLFRALSTDPQVELKAYSGDFPSNFEVSLLNQSPIKDVLVEQKNINQYELQCDADSLKKYYSNLCKIYPFKALMARPLNIQGEYAYALFVFSKIIQPEWHHKSELFSAISEMVATAIERKILEEKFIQHQQFYVKGQISSSLIHELKNEELIISNSILQLERLMKLTKDTNFKYSNVKFLIDFHETVNTLLEYDERINKIHKIFLTLLRQHEVIEIDLDEHLDLLCKTMQYFAKEHKITLNYIKSMEKVPVQKINVTYLDNILSNLIINAIEQTRLLPFEKGEIKLELRYNLLSNYPVNIRVMDNGPGIHQTHHDHIFELLFTSKPHGSGMGLYISQALVRAIKGKLQIESTCRFGGTTMLIELPYQKGQKR